MQINSKNRWKPWQIKIKKNTTKHNDNSNNGNKQEEQVETKMEHF